MILQVPFSFFQIEHVMLEIPFPRSVLNVMLSQNQGKYSFDPTTKVLTWDIGKIDTTKLPNIKGTVCITKWIIIPV